jgi:hypothetical protein
LLAASNGWEKGNFVTIANRRGKVTINTVDRNPNRIKIL